jgi:hypothetical protein
MRVSLVTSRDVAALCAALAGSRRGIIAVQTAILLVVLLGFVSFAVDIGSMLLQRRAMQSAADSAAWGAALAATVKNPPDFTVEGKSITASYGYANGSSGTVVQVNNPPTLGAYQSNSLGVEVLITRPYSAILASLFHPTAFSIAARAVALVGKSGNGCILALAPSVTSAVLASGSASVTVNTCDVYIQSTSSSALLVSGGAVVNGEDIRIVGGYKTTGSGVVNATQGVQTGALAVADPYSALAVPAYSGCGHTNLSVSTVTTLSPGVYCGGIAINGAQVTLNPGQYILDGGNFSVIGNATVTGSGVTIILTSSTGSSKIGSVSIGGGGTIALSAMLTGTTAGVVFYQDQNAPTSGSNSFQGNASMVITGAIYFPRQSLSYSGSTTGSSSCTQVVAMTIQFTGSVSLALNCTGIPIRSIGPTTQPTLVE